MVARIQMNVSLEEFDAITERVKDAYLPWYRDLERRIEHRPAAFEAPMEVVERFDRVELKDTRILTKILFSRQDRVIVLLADHTYLGGFLLSQFVQLVFCEKVTKGIFPRNPYYPVVSELMILAFLARAAVLPGPAATELFPSPAQTRRIYWKQSRAELEALANGMKMNVLYVLIANQIHTVMNELRRDRLRVTLPVSFEADNSFNTVGAIFLNVKATKDLESMAKYVRREVKRGQWQVSASNHVQRVLPTRHLSERARRTADFTLTVVPQKTLPHNLLKEEVQDYEFTMDNIEYPVYAMSFMFEDHIHTSMMINTPSFDVEGFCAKSGAKVSDLTLDSSARARAR
ncbi:MAG: hypothetical protein H6721_24895 [Sandaracinus sp.]|nr:hypothetical protein [Sandaracinus sp.]